MLNARLDRIESLLQTFHKNQAPPHYSISIDQAEFHAPVIDELNYHFDRLDVKEVSGALNMGNNFGVKVGQVKSTSEKTADSQKSNSQSTAQKLSEQLIKPSSSGQTLQPKQKDQTAYQKDIQQESVPKESTTEPRVSATLKENTTQDHINNQKVRHVRKEFEPPLKRAKRADGETGLDPGHEVPFKLTIRGRS